MEADARGTAGTNEEGFRIEVTVKVKTYEQFLQDKTVQAPSRGVDYCRNDISPILKPHQRDIVLWAVSRGLAAIFAAFGLGKTLMQLEIARLLCSYPGGRFLIVIPLGVRQEFRRDAELLGIELQFVQSSAEVGGPGIYLTNYESVRDGKIDPALFMGVSLDEAAILADRGNKTFGQFTFELFTQTPFKFVATATPSPNEYQELLSYAAFLGVADIGQVRTRFFKRNSTKMDELTLHPHKEREFWLWLSTWAIFLQKPSDLGYSDEGYSLPEMEVHWHEVPTNHSQAGHEKSGQAKLLRNAAIGVVDAAREKRESIPARLQKLQELRDLDRTAHRVLWHDLESEREAIEKHCPGVATVYGKQDLTVREDIIVKFSNGEIQELATKPVIAGSGCNFQRHCAWEIFFGINFKFRNFIQAIHRVHRFLQTTAVRIDLIYTEAEREVKRELEEKWRQHNELTAKMSEIIREYGLAANIQHRELTRTLGVARIEESGELWRFVNNDAIYETRNIEGESVGLVCTSLPFGNQYEYTPSYHDFGHTDSNNHFFEQMDYLTPNLLRVLKPGRVAAIHCKDRVVPSGMTGLGFQTVYAFHADIISHFCRHGFAFLGMKTIVTDVVRENNQTYRLGWTEQCKDGSRMGAGLPEYLLLFRRPQTDRSNGYADEPVVKEKELYTRGRWQIDAHGFARSDGNRLLTADEMIGQRWGTIYRNFRQHSLKDIYEYEGHVDLSEKLDAAGRLPVDFMLLPPQSWHPDVWTDITRMRTLNGAQSAAGREMHICPLQFDLVDRVIRQYSMSGELVYDPFAGIGTVPYRAIALGRRALACELSTRYFHDGVAYCRAAEAQASVPTLFDLTDEPVLEESTL